MTQLSLTMDVTNQCNSRCKTCYFSLPGFKPKGRNMTLDEFKLLADKLRGATGRLALSCEFEPLLHPDIEEIIKACAPLSATWQIRLNTNGLLLSEAVSQALATAGIAELYVSIDAPTPALNALIRGNQALPRIIRELKRLAEIKKISGATKPVCILRSTAMQANLQELPDMIPLCAEVGAERYCIKHLLPIAECTWEGRPLAEQSCLLIPEATHMIFERIRALGNELGVTVDLPPARPREAAALRIACGYAENGFHIFPDGTCYPCVWLTTADPYGNIFRDDLAAVLASAARQRFQKGFQPPHTPAKCLDCLCDAQTVGLKAQNDARARLEKPGSG